MTEKTAYARIVVPSDRIDGATMTQGTKVFVGDVRFSGVTKIELTADVNDVWRARITVMVKPPADLMSDAVVFCPTLCQRIKRWVSGKC